MDGYSSFGAFTDGQKPLDDSIIRSGAIDKKQVLVVKSCISELLGVVHPLVESYDGGDPVAAEVVEVVVGCVQWVAILDPALVVRSSKG